MIHTIGITGGIGSGKSVVSRTLETMGIPVYDCDSRAKALYDESLALQQGIIRLVGEEVYATPNGRLDRALLAQRIFADRGLLVEINELVHPAVREDFCLWRSRQEQESYALCALESALLLGRELETFVDTKVVVVAPEELRLERAMHRDQTTKEAIKARMAHQMSQEEMMTRGDAVLYNEPHRPLLPQLWSLVDQLRAGLE